jgi:hypothetical protein
MDRIVEKLKGELSADRSLLLIYAAAEGNVINVSRPTSGYLDQRAGNSAH